MVAESLFDNCRTILTQQPDHPQASDAGQESPVGDGGKNHSILCHKDVRGRKFCYISQNIANNGIIETSSMRFEQRAGVVGVKATSFGIHGHRLERGSSKL